MTDSKQFTCNHNISLKTVIRYSKAGYHQR